ncbi:hypothetical protein NVV43_31110, partial [Escherichia marmotae]|nr:hypothetical protein [Escherichia marmotae]
IQTFNIRHRRISTYSWLILFSAFRLITNPDPPTHRLQQPIQEQPEPNTFLGLTSLSIAKYSIN